MTPQERIQKALDQYNQYWHNNGWPHIIFRMGTWTIEDPQGMIKPLYLVRLYSEVNGIVACKFYQGSNTDEKAVMEEAVEKVLTFGIEKCYQDTVKLTRETPTLLINPSRKQPLTPDDLKEPVKQKKVTVEIFEETKTATITGDFNGKILAWIVTQFPVAKLTEEQLVMLKEYVQEKKLTDTIDMFDTPAFKKIKDDFANEMLTLGSAILPSDDELLATKKDSTKVDLSASEIPDGYYLWKLNPDYFTVQTSVQNGWTPVRVKDNIVYFTEQIKCGKYDIAFEDIKFPTLDARVLIIDVVDPKEVLRKLTSIVGPDYVLNSKLFTSQEIELLKELSK